MFGKEVVSEGENTNKTCRYPLLLLLEIEVSVKLAKCYIHLKVDMSTQRKKHQPSKQAPSIPAKPLSPASTPREDLSHLPEHLRIQVPEPDPKDYQQYEEPHRSVMIKRFKNNARMAIWAKKYHGPISVSNQPRPG